MVQRAHVQYVCYRHRTFQTHSLEEYASFCCHTIASHGQLLRLKSMILPEICSCLTRLLAHIQYAYNLQTFTHVFLNSCV